MSIYGGFPTRTLEAAYNQSLCGILNLLQNFILHILKSKKTTDTLNWCEEFCRDYHKLEKLERQKHLLPNFSENLKELDEYIKATTTIYSSGKFSERKSPPTTSTGSFMGDLGYTRMEIYRARQSSLPGYRKREDDLSFKKNTKKYMRNVNVKVYQDQILKNILRDLSTPYVE